MLHESFLNVDILVYNFHKEITLVFDDIYSFSSKYKNIIQIRTDHATFSYHLDTLRWFMHKLWKILLTSSKELFWLLR